jgi:multiple sugar transport system substrate-binding protein
MRRLWFFALLITIFSLLLVACGPAPTTESGSGENSSDGGDSGEAKDFITWYQYDQNNEDPASDERVGNEYLRQKMPVFNAEFAGKWNWINQPKAFDKMVTELITAVQAAGEVPDLMHMSSGDLLSFYQNGTVQDLTEWAQAQSWYGDVDPHALAVCQGPDGKLYCIPVAQSPQVVFVWKDRFPDGYPTTPEQFLARAAELKEQKLYAITFFGSTDFDGEGLNRFMWTAISSFGGKLDDGQGNMKLNTPENIRAIEFIRTLVTEQYVPEIAFAGQFQEENAFKDASAGSLPTGLFGYRYTNPLTAPDGTAYDKGNEQDMLDAITAGDIFLAPFFAAEGEKPGCGTFMSGFVIPVGAKNVEAAHDYINWIMSPEQNADWVLAPGGGLPTLTTTEQSERFQTPFYKEAAAAIAASVCTPWFGSLERRDEAKVLIMNTIYKLIKEDPTADIASTLTAAEEEYNAGN